jgi:cupin superfamily acireductone dioxygenase involved in methionine salvage
MDQTVFSSIGHKFNFKYHKIVKNILNLTFNDDQYIDSLQKFSLSHDQIFEYYGYIIEKIIGSVNNLSHLEGPWLTVYSKGDKMESHCHKNFEYTLMHYISLDASHSQTILEDTTTGKEYDFNCVEGDIIIIPGHVNHRVDENTNIKKRIVGVFNFNSENFVAPKEVKNFEIKTPVKNILENYIYPGDENLLPIPIPEGMCKNCSINEN